ncbi:DNA helicase [Microbacterium phage Zeta1847]|uniref:DNA helicase n=1 Tax=Microbacterium phage Zeta1847 TaxID=2201444 RepID=A0A2Z4Q9K7_9CAUD|nr:DNA primase [Microbacterium phage Zeta1847]AWY06671.1 DNA helicase [Microbacterium phage Zeta1847]
MQLTDLLPILDAVEESDGWLARCPAHDDSHASLRVTVSEAGKVLIKCRAGCATLDVVKSLGLTIRDLATMSSGGAEPTKRATSTDTPANPAAVAELAVQLDEWAHALPVAVDALAYAADRFGLSAPDAIRLGLGYAERAVYGPDRELLSGLPGGPRLVVPFRDRDGVARGYQARALAADARVRWYGPESPEGESWARIGYFPAAKSTGEVLVCEGPGDALTGVALGWDTVGVRGAGLAANASVVRELATLIGERVAVIAGDGDKAGRKFAAELADALVSEGVAVRVLELPDGLDLTDWRGQAGATMGGELARAIAAAKLREPTVHEPDDIDPTKPLAGLAPRDIVAAILNRYEFARTPEGGIVTIERHVSGAGVAEEVSDLPATIARMVWDEAEESLKPQEMSSAKTTLTAIANNAPVRPAPLRTFETGDGIVVDLGRDDGRIVHLSADGWEVTGARERGAPAFRRTRATEPLPLPQRGGSRETLRKVLGLEPGSREWRLIYGWLVGSLFEASSRPVLWVSGPQGSGKSTRARMVKSVIDPALGPTGREGALGAAPTGDERDDTTSAAGQFVPSWDNISSVPTATSDWFCTLVTGAATARRRLYTDGDMYIQRIRRTGVATSIAMPLGLRPDALERLVSVELERVPMEERQTEGAVWREFREAHPEVLGALFDDIVGVLRNLEAASRQRIALPRMADYAEHLIALDLHVGLPPGSHESYSGAYIESVDEAITTRAGDDPLVTALVKLTSGRKGYGYLWEGTATELRDALADYRPTDPSEWWPSGPAQLAAEVLKASEAARALGLTVTKERIGKARTRVIRLVWNAPTCAPEEPDEAPAPEPPRLGQADTPREASSPHTHITAGADLDSVL